MEGKKRLKNTPHNILPPLTGIVHNQENDHYGLIDGLFSLELDAEVFPRKPIGFVDRETLYNK